MLTLPIKKKWFDMITLGEKIEEYRNITPYYEARFLSVFGAEWFFVGIKKHDNTGAPEREIILRNGYSKKSKQIKITCTLGIGEGKTEWGAEPGQQYYILYIKKVEKEEE